LNFQACSPGLPARPLLIQLARSDPASTNSTTTQILLALKYCIDKIGTDRIMWAIDPYEPMSRAAAWIDLARISDEEREKICRDNAERIFRIVTQ